MKTKLDQVLTDLLSEAASEVEAAKAAGMSKALQYWYALGKSEALIQVRQHVKEL